jgi:cell fate regulator YaaT (PSP1 superfamily)
VPGEVVEVLFKGEERGLFTNPTPVILRLGNHVVVEADKGEEMGRVILKGMWVSKKAGEAPVRKIIRKATREDMERHAANAEKETEAFKVCKERIEERELKMKLVDVECRFDGNRITFYFTAEKRVDFRELVKDLAAIYRTRIELRQIGVRDEAKRIGGFGSCGRKYCCTSFLREFEPVTLKMAKEQHLSLSPTKISGACGRLMCCLMYEVDTYRRCLGGYPKVGSKIRIEGKEVQVGRVDIFREGIFVHDPETGERFVSREELRADGRRGGVERVSGAGEEEERGSDAAGRPGPIGDETAQGVEAADDSKGVRDGDRARDAKADGGTPAARESDRSPELNGSGERRRREARAQEQARRGRLEGDRPERPGRHQIEGSKAPAAETKALGDDAKDRGAEAGDRRVGAKDQRDEVKAQAPGTKEESPKQGGSEGGPGKQGPDKLREASGKSNRKAKSKRGRRRWRRRDKRNA